MNPALTFVQYSTDCTVAPNTFNEITVAGKVVSLPDPAECKGAVVAVVSAFDDSMLEAPPAIHVSTNYTKVLPLGTVSGTNPAWCIYRRNCHFFRSNGTKWVCLSSGSSQSAYILSSTNTHSTDDGGTTTTTVSTLTYTTYL